MVKKTLSKKITKEVKDYVADLKQDKLPINKVIVFGSYAKGSAHKWSDIDVCIISPKFNDSWKALQYLWLKRTKNDAPSTIEPVGFSPKDFKEGSSLINEIKKYGVEIKI